MIKLLLDMFSYTFLVRAVTVGLLVSLCASLLGVSLVLKRYSMIGDGLSHVGFGALAVAAAMNAAPLSVSIPATVLAAFLLLRISENSKIKGDAAIALISTSALAIGVIVISVTTGMNTDVCNYMFGSILAMSRSDVRLSIVLSTAVLILFVLFYCKIFAVTFDETFSRAVGTKAGIYNMLIAILTAVTIVLGMRMMGAMLISALIIFPALTSMRVCKRFLSVVICSAAVSVTCFFIGVVLSYLYSLPTGASVVAVNIVMFLLFGVIGIAKRGPAKSIKGLFVSVFAITLIFAGCSSEKTGTHKDSTAFPPLSSSGADAKQGGQVPSSLPELAHDTAVPPSEGDMVEISEKLFIAQTNDIYINTEDYLGKTIKYEGIFKTTYWPEEDKTFYFVIRYGPGCCGYDGEAGFEIMWNGEWPEEDDWCEAVGTLEAYEENGWQYLRLVLSSLTVLEERGQEFVST